MSGSWIFTVGAQSVHVYGQVVAKNAFGDLYVVPMVDILNDIGDVCRVPSVSKHEEGFASEVGDEESSSPCNTIGTIAAGPDDNSDTAAHVRDLDKETRLRETIPQAVAAQLKDESPYVPSAALPPPGKKPSLSDETLQAVTTRLEHEDPDVRQAAVEVLGKQSPLPDEMLQAVAARLQHKDRDVRQAAVQRHFGWIIGWITINLFAYFTLDLTKMQVGLGTELAVAVVIAMLFMFYFCINLLATILHQRRQKQVRQSN